MSAVVAASRSDVVAYGAVLTGAVCVPLVFTTWVDDIFATPEFVVLALATAVAAGAAFIARSLTGRPPRASVAPVVGAYLAWATVATLASRAPAVSLLGLLGRYDGWLTSVFMVVFATVVVDRCWDRPDRIEWLAVALVAGATVGSVYVWVQQLGFDWTTWYTASGAPIPYPQGALGNSNFSAAHIAITLPLVVGLARRLQGWKNTAIIAAVPFLVGAIWFTSSRGAMLAALVGVGIAGLLLPNGPRRWLWSALCAVGAAGVAVSVAFVVVGGSSVPGPLSDLDIFRTGSVDVRGHLWPAALDAVMAHPVVGTGPDTFFVTYLEHRGLDGARGRAFAAEPHNIFLDLAVSQGLIGLGLFVAVVVLVVRGSLRASRDPILAGFVGMLSAYLIQGVFSVDTVGVTVLAWIAMGGIVALSDPRLVAARSVERDPDRSAAQRVSVALVAGVVLIGLVWSLGAFRVLRADHHVKAAVAAPASRRSIHELRTAVDLVPIQPDYRRRLAARLVVEAGRTSGDDAIAYLAEAEREIERALDLFPDRVDYLHVWSDIDVARARLGDPGGYPRALEHLERAREIDPYGWSTLDRLGAVTAASAVGSDDRDATIRTAIGYYLRSAELDPNRAAPWREVLKLSLLIDDNELTSTARSELAQLAAP